MMDGGQPLTTASFDTVSRKVGPTGHISTGSTFDVRFDSAKMFMHTGSRPSHFNLLGWAYGPTVRGINVKSSYLWSGVNFAGYALPFTQVFLRPMLSDANAGFRAIPNAGLPAAPRPVLPSSVPQHLDWGVRNVRIASDDPDSMGNSPVLGLAQIGNTLYVGGKFQTVQHFSTGATAHQPWLAAFDIRSGNWISSFHPTLDGAVFDLIAAPDGTLLVGGNFTNINGAAHTAGLAKLDPATGAVVVGWNVSLTGARFGEQHAYARSLDVRGPWVYVAGGFNGVDGGPSSTALAAGGAARVSLADGTPDITWHPFFDFAPSDIIASADGNRVYVAGAFNHTGVSNVMNFLSIGFAILRADDATSVTGLGPVHLNNPGHPEQLAVTEYGSEVFHGGNQHWLASYDSSAFGFRNGASMGPRGDVQSIAGMYGLVFAGCHCLGYSLHVPAVGQADRVDRLNWMGAWNPTTFDRVEAFEPQWTMAGTGEGVWRIMADSDNCMWTASDVIQGATTSDHLGGIARFCPGDTTAPSVPRMMKRIGTKLVWAASTDNVPGPLRYEILRNDRVVAVTTTRAFTPKTHGRYFIRAIDSAGNIGATTRVINS